MCAVPASPICVNLCSACSSARVLEMAQTLAESDRWRSQQAEFQVRLDPLISLWLRMLRQTNFYLMNQTQ